jgi:hypothetical protein
MRRRVREGWRSPLGLAWALALVACGQRSADAPASPPDPGLDDAVALDDVTSAADTTSAPDAAEPIDAAPFPVRRLPCVGRSGLAKGLPSDGYGALEGELVSIVPPGNKTCPSDADHLHLQVLVDAKRYDVAVTIDTTFAPPLALYVKPLPPTLPPLGWADERFDYEKNLGIPSADFKPLDKAALLARLQTELAKAARVRLFGRGYTDGTGAHFVHRNGRDRDGVLIVHRAEPDGSDRAIALRFANQVF